jgi:hypothetical protein
MYLMNYLKNLKNGRSRAVRSTVFEKGLDSCAVLNNFLDCLINLIGVNKKSSRDFILCEYRKPLRSTRVAQEFALRPPGLKLNFGNIRKK